MVHTSTGVSCTANNEIIKEVKNGSAVQVRKTFSAGDKYTEFPPLKNMDESMRITPDPILMRPFLSRVVTWTTSNARFSSIHQSNFPSVTISSNALAIQAFQIATLYRAKACFRVSLTGTLAHQGMLLAAVRPLTTNTLNTALVVNSLLTGPHAFLSANEASSVCLEIPFMASSQLLPTQINGPAICTFKGSNASFSGADYAELVLYVLNPLSVAAGTATSISVVIETEFKELEMYVPRNNNITWTAQAAKCVVSCAGACVGKCCYDAWCAQSSSYGKIATGVFDGIANGTKNTVSDVVDAIRESLRFYTGLHNPNEAAVTDKMVMTPKNPSNIVDSTTRFNKLDPYSQFDRVVNDFRFLTKEDEMLVSNIVKKPQYVGTFSISTSDTSGKLLFARPISPNQGYAGIKSASPVGSVVAVCNNIEHLYNSTRAWSGSLKLHIQAVMTAKHSVKLQVSKYYVPALNALSATGTPDMYSLSGQPTELIEFSQGNQIVEVTLPFCSQLRCLYNTKDLSANAVQHGIYYIHLAQPLVIGDNVPTTAEFNVYISCGDDFTFYGYATDSYLSGGTALLLDAKTPVGLHRVYEHAGKEANIDEIYKKHFNLVNKQTFIDLNPEFYDTSDVGVVAKMVKRNQRVYGTYTSKISQMREWPELRTPSEFKRTFGTEFPVRYTPMFAWPAISEFNANTFPDVFKNKFGFSHDLIPELVGIRTLKTFNDWFNRVKSTSAPEFQFKVLYESIRSSGVPYDDPMFRKTDVFQVQSAEVMNAPSSQEVLIDSSKTKVVDDKSYSNLLYPLVSVRDILRRLSPGLKTSWNDSAGSSSPLVAIELGRPTPTIGDVISSRTIITMMYYGADVGEKFKLLVSGCNSGSVVFNPPSVGFNAANLVRTSSYRTTALPMSTMDTNFALPFIELPDQWVTKTNATTNEGTAMCVFEGVVPNINPCEYASTPGTNTGYSLAPSASLGELVFAVPNDFEAEVGESGQVKVYIASTDESRFGFHMYAPLMFLSLATTTPYALTTCANPATATGTADIVYTAVPPYVYFSTLNTAYN